MAFGLNSRRAMGLIDEKIEEGYQRRATENGWKEKKGVWFDFRIGGDFEKGRVGGGDAEGEWERGRKGVCNGGV